MDVDMSEYWNTDKTNNQDFSFKVTAQWMAQDGAKWFCLWSYAYVAKSMWTHEQSPWGP